MLAVLQIFDVLFTLIAVRGGATELNPLMRVALAHSPGAFILVKALLCTLSMGVLYRFRATKALFGACVLYAVVVLYHAVNLLHW